MVRLDVDCTTEYSVLSPLRKLGYEAMAEIVDLMLLDLKWHRDGIGAYGFQISIESK